MTLQQLGRGFQAQRRLEPAYCFGRHMGPAAFDAKPAAVMVALYEDAGEICFPLIRRPATMASHAGQVSLPGGALEGVESSVEAAARELEEELGISIEPSQVLGVLTETFIFGSNYRVTPVIAALNEVPVLSPCEREVDSVITCRIEDLGKVVSQILPTKLVGDRPMPGYLVENQFVWGATAMILSELYDVHITTKLF